ncbi:DUF5339 domain-containing protein [Pasteurella canis]|uniref:Putative TonB-dependent receptor protein n=1 Tax=Pasteurella canis TaxID=753 RepID=A0A379EXK7_9PAST|nr:DUF5339 domain-containing protein [Pasteurella canis]MXN88108.1 TonB-dependent receptor [Pasteurella canis]UAX42170.1 DUF5339 domain-containing protein [Pasteurella canis]UAY77724.1 DUF5339 domain-containing protein [Pasteurella canis]UDW83746.1 DUF5339 domain-containing protein [Pasteurella canis]UEA16817.1 DUF5339 domain-containing protein [Pasteurella canis]
MKKLFSVIALSSFAMTVSAADLAPACEKYFTEYEGFLKNVPAEQAAMVKQQYDAAKQQFAAMPKDMQEQTCNQAIEQLKQMKAAMGQK